MPSEQDFTRQQRALVRAYSQFWSQPAFRKGVKRPFGHRGEVHHLLERAAAIVVRVRADLDAQATGTKPASPRYIDGASRDFFWQVRYKPHATPARFVRELVHATLKDANGYVEGLDFEKVEAYVAKFDPLLQAKGGDADHTLELRTQLDEAWHKASDVIAELRDLSAKGELSGDEYTDSLKRCVAACEALAGQAHYITKVAAKKRHGDEEHTGKKAHTPKVNRKSTPRTPTQSPSPAPSPAPTPSEDPEPEHDSAEEEAHKEAYSGHIEVKKVAHEVSFISEGVGNLTDRVTSLDPAVLAQDPKTNLERLAELQHRCEVFTDGLINDLNRLDSLEGLAIEDRPLRKAQVDEVQHLIDEVQAVNEKLHQMSHQLMEQLHKQQAEAAAAPEPTKPEPKPTAAEEAPNAAPEQQVPEKAEAPTPSPKPAAKAEEPKIEVATPGKKDKAIALTAEKKAQLEELWGQLKLHPHFEVMESLYDYLVQGYVPGLKQSDIDVQLSGRHGNTLTIKGVRKPIDKEYQRMLKFMPEASLEEVLRMGVGRFGSFTEVYTLPEDVDKERIEAHYEGGVLRVILPKLRTLKHAQHPAPPLLGSAGLPDLMRDRDLWW